MRQEMINWKMEHAVIGIEKRAFCSPFGMQVGFTSCLIQRRCLGGRQRKNLYIYILKGIKMVFLTPRLTLLQPHKRGCLWDNSQKEDVLVIRPNMAVKRPICDALTNPEKRGHVNSTLHF